MQPGTTVCLLNKLSYVELSENLTREAANKICSACVCSFILMFVFKFRKSLEVNL